jgi:hypothetical protein
MHNPFRRKSMKWSNISHNACENLNTISLPTNKQDLPQVQMDVETTNLLMGSKGVQQHSGMKISSYSIIEPRGLQNLF